MAYFKVLIALMLFLFVLGVAYQQYQLNGCLKQADHNFKTVFSAYRREGHSQSYALTQAQDFQKKWQDACFKRYK